MKKLLFYLLLISPLTYAQWNNVQVLGSVTNGNLVVWEDGNRIQDAGILATDFTTFTGQLNTNTADIQSLEANAIESNLWTTVRDAATNAVPDDATYTAFQGQVTTNAAAIEGKLGTNAIIRVNGTNYTWTGTTNDLGTISATNLIARADDVVWPLTYSNKVHILLIGQSLAFGNASGTPTAMDRDYIEATSTWEPVGGAGVPNAYFAKTGISTNYVDLTFTSGKTRMTDDNAAVYWGYDISASEQIRRWGRRNVYWTKWAVGGTGLDPANNPSWTPDDNTTYTSLYTHITVALTNMAAQYPAAGDVDVVVWGQGEQDALDATWAANYYDNLTNLIATLRLDLGNPTLPWVLMGLTDEREAGYGPVVRAALKRVALEDPYCTFCDQHTQPRQSDATNHMDHEGNWTTGEMLAGAILGAISGQKFTLDGLDVMGPVRGEWGHFDQGLFSQDIEGRTANIDSISDVYGPIRGAVSDRGLVAYIDMTEDGPVDKLGSITSWTATVDDFASYMTNTQNAARDYAHAGGRLESDQLITGLAGATNYSIGWWLKFPETVDVNNQRIVDPAAEYFGEILALGVSDHSDEFQFVVSGGANIARVQPVWNPVGGKFMYGQNSINWRDWTHVLYTWDGTASKVYYNGDLAGSNSVTAVDVTLDGNLYIGGTTNTPNNGSFQAACDWWIDDVSVWTRALSETEAQYLSGGGSGGGTGIKSIASASASDPYNWTNYPVKYTPTELDLQVLYTTWNGTNRLDLLANAATGAATADLATADVGGARGVVLDDGQYRNNLAAAMAGAANGTCTIACWIKSDGTGTEINQDFMGFRDTGGSAADGLVMGIGNTTTNAATFGLSYNNNSAGSLSIIFSPTFDLGDWHFVVATGDVGTSNAVMYVDGVEIGRVTDYAITTSYSFCYFGRSSTQGDVANSLYYDDFQVYGRVLASEEIKNLYELQRRGDRGFFDLPYEYHSGTETIMSDATTTNTVIFVNGKVTSWL